MRPPTRLLSERFPFLYPVSVAAHRLDRRAPPPVGPPPPPPPRPPRGPAPPHARGRAAPPRVRPVPGLRPRRAVRVGRGRLLQLRGLPVRQPRSRDVPHPPVADRRGAARRGVGGPPAPAPSPRARARP